MSASTESMLEPKKSLRRVMKAKLRQMSAEDMQGESEAFLTGHGSASSQLGLQTYDLTSLYNFRSPCSLCRQCNC